MNISTESYLTQSKIWPSSGRHILAQYDENSIVVYQAYRPETGHFAAKHGRFGDGFSLNRMSWVKPNFLWMMHRSGWGTKEGQEVVLAIRLSCEFWEEVLSQAVSSSYVPELYGSEEKWHRELAKSEVRLQWDPDHGPYGEKVERRDIQIGIRGQMLRRYVNEALEIEDISEFVAAQYQHVRAGHLEQLQTPAERVFWPRNELIPRRLGLTQKE